MGKTGAALNNGIKSFVDNNVTEAIRLLTPLAAVGYEVAQLNLAYIYKVPVAFNSYLPPFTALTIFSSGKAWSTGSCDSSAAACCWAGQRQSSRHFGQFRLLGHWHSVEFHVCFAALCSGREVGECAWRVQLWHDVRHASLPPPFQRAAHSCISRYLLGDGVSSDLHEARLWCFSSSHHATRAHTHAHNVRRSPGSKRRANWTRMPSCHAFWLCAFPSASFQFWCRRETSIDTCHSIHRLLRNVVLPLMAYQAASNMVHSIAKASLSSAPSIPTSPIRCLLFLYSYNDTIPPQY